MRDSHSQRERILRTLAEHAPKMPVANALGLADEFQRNFDEMMDAAEALAVLSETVLGYDSRVGFGDRFKSARPAVQLAIRNVSYRHGWVTCGPVADGMERLLAEWDARALKDAPHA